MSEAKEEKKEESAGVEKVHSDFNAMDIIHELAESTNIQAATHRKEADVNQLYAKANVLLVQTNNDLSKNIINLNNALSQARTIEASGTDTIKDKLDQIEKQIEVLKQKAEKIEAVSEKIEKLLPSLMEMISKDNCTKK